jgi:pimeloyl-ACP methyl ester carboxylesterase
MDDALRVLDAAGPTGRASQLVHHVPPIALAARPFHVVGGAEAVARRTRVLPRGDSQQPPARAIRRTAPALAVGPRLPILYLHGTDDGYSEDYTPWIERVLPDESELALVENGGHFLQLDQPDVVAPHIVDFVGQASQSEFRTRQREFRTVRCARL